MATKLDKEVTRETEIQDPKTKRVLVLTLCKNRICIRPKGLRNPDATKSMALDYIWALMNPEPLVPTNPMAGAAP